MARRPRALHPDERELWTRVAATARAMHPEWPERPVPAESHPPPKKSASLWKTFHIGEKAKAHPPAHNLAYPESLGPRPVRMDRKTYDRMVRGKLVPEARIDLHGMTLSEAHPELIRFILNAHSDGLRLVLVITGKGKRRQDHGPIPERIGALRHQVPHWLALPPLGTAVLQVAQAGLKHGGAGAYYVYLRRG